MLLNYLIALYDQYEQSVPENHVPVQVIKKHLNRFIIMKYLLKTTLLILGACFIISASASIINTTEFYNKQTGQQLYFQSFSGYEDVNSDGSASIYYSLWQGHLLSWDDKSVPLIIWLQGGPGAPSQFGCFNEVGPITIEGKKGNLKATQNPWAWNFYGHLMCVDQPVGVGFSYNNGSYRVNNTRDAATHFVKFLSNFFKNNPNLGLGKNPLYLAGESYAGHYIPAFADKILTDTSLGFNLAGVLIGDGWVDPMSQTNNYDSYLNSVGAVSNEWRDTTSFMQNEALVRLMRGQLKEASGYINFIIANDDVARKYYLGMNVLNYKQYDDGNINGDYKYFLQDNKKAFGVPDWVNYVDDNQQMYEDFAADISMSFKRQLERVLTANIRTLIYNGQNDLIVNTAGVLNYINTLEWQYINEWKQKPKKIWSQYGSSNLGWYKQTRNFIFAQVRNAGHLLPADQPRTAWSMLNKYFLNSW